MNEQLRINIRMQLVALRQLLRDMSEKMSDDEKNLILNQIIRLSKLLQELEK